MFKKILFLNPPSYSRYDSAGARFQATRVTQSLWYPAWLGYTSALVPKSKLLDAPAKNLTIDEVVTIVKNYDVIVIYTSTPGLENDFKVAKFLKKSYPKKKIIFVGPHVSILDTGTLNKCLDIDGVIRKEFDLAVLEIAKNKPWSKIKSLTYRKSGQIIRNPDSELINNLDQLPFVSKIYKRDLPIRSYHLPFALYPYIAIYSGRGCPNRCTFCLWPQTFTGRVYRKRSVDNVIKELEYIKKKLPEIKEVFFDDDTFTADRQWLEEFCQKVKSLSITWSCNARADLNYEILKKLKSAGCRVLVVGYESSSQEILNNVKKGVKVEQLERFTLAAHKANLLIHGTFVLGLEGESLKTMQNTLDFAKKLNLETLQVSVATPLPGTEFYNLCLEKDYFVKSEMVDNTGYQEVSVSYPNLSSNEIKKFSDIFLKEYYFRFSYFYLMLKLIITQPREFSRVFRNSLYFFKYLLKK
jgi:hopanoid biosynthesis associated radical SAM protein HpnJ